MSSICFSLCSEIRLSCSFSLCAGVKGQRWSNVWLQTGSFRNHGLVKVSGLKALSVFVETCTPSMVLQTGRQSLSQKPNQKQWFRRGWQTFSLTTFGHKIEEVYIERYWLAGLQHDFNTSQPILNSKDALRHIVCRRRNMVKLVLKGLKDCVTDVKLCFIV